MYNSQLARIIRSLSASEQRELRKFITSPYFNQRTDVVALYDWIASHQLSEAACSKVQAIADLGWPDDMLRLRMTYLMRLIEQYLIQKESEMDDLSRQLLLITRLRKRRMDAAFVRQQKYIEQQLSQHSTKDHHFYEAQYRLQWECHEQMIAQPAHVDHLLAASEALDTTYWIQKLKLICLVVAQQSVYTTAGNVQYEQETIAFATQYAPKEHSISIYIHCYLMMRHPEEGAHFAAFKQLLLETATHFSKEDNRSLLTWAVNYCVRRINFGQKHFYKEATDLYKYGLEHGLLLENNEISGYAYSNIIAAGLQADDTAWAYHVIQTYKNNLPRALRESMYSFNMARYAYANEDYNGVLELLQQVRHRDILVDLAAKTMLIKTWFALDEYDTLQSHLDAMRNFIHRKKILGYHRTNYLNIIKYTDRLLNLNRTDKKAVEQLRAMIVQEEHLTEREWLLEQL